MSVTRLRNINILFFGPPGAGKGTQAEAVAPLLDVAHVSTGDLFRMHMREGTELGLRIKPIYESGAYVPDDLTIAMLDDHLGRLRADRPALRGVLFDGFPRTLPQIEALDAFLTTRGERVDAAVYLDVPRSVLLARLLGRGRADDTPAAVEKRLEVYETQTQPLLAHFDARGLLQRVNGDQPVENVTTAVVAVLAPLFEERT